MDSEESLGDVLVCGPISGLVNVCSSSSQSNESGSNPEVKKTDRISKPKNAIKELNIDHSTESEEIKPVSHDVKNLQDLVSNLRTSDESAVQKPKKVKKRRKANGKNKSNNEPNEISSSVVEAVGSNRPTDQVKLNTPKKQESSRSGRGTFTFVTQYKQEPCTPNNRVEEVANINNKEGGKKTPRKSSAKKKNEKEVFDDYLPINVVEQGLKDKTMVSGPIRINPRCYKEAYLSEGDEKDIMIEGLHNRNRALEGDEVVVLINPPELWKANGQRTGKVVFIKEKFHSRSCIGKLPSSIEPNSSYVVFSPRDPRVPRIRIPLADGFGLPKDYSQNPYAYVEIMFLAKITAWTEVSFAQGIIEEEIGKSGDVEVETLAILYENGLDPKPFSPVINIFFPRIPFKIPEEEIQKRADLRKECIFTIDPATARDLDDAVSAKLLDNGNIEVGVHISDVSHFLQPNTLLDHQVSKRATTIYLVQRVYHMLPVELCHLCSLTAGEDKLAFSVFVELTPDAKVVSHRFARSVIHSCAKFAYEHAQMVIDNPEKTFSTEDFPEIVNGFTAEDCARTIRELYKLSVIMRQRRFDSGALRIDQPKLCFHLDPETQQPLSSFVYENKESHRLIEEFMLLANMTVAKHIYNAFPKLAFLRHHLPPKANMMTELKKRLETYGIHLDITDAGTVHSSMRKYSCALPDEDGIMTWARYIILNNLVAKPMLRASYFCPSDGDCDLHHYALNAPYYTHFTSPIRRYPDIMVHRLLAASLDLTPKPTWSHLDTKRIAFVCNRQKLAAKLAGEQSSLLFLALFLREPVRSAAAVLDVKDRSFDVIVQDYGILLRVYTDPLPAKIEFCNEDNMPQLYIKWDDGRPIQLIQLFSVVQVQISVKDNVKLTAALVPPD